MLILAAALIATLALSAAPAEAAPFCVSAQSEKVIQCYYEDIDECQRDAALQDGYCTVNIATLPTLPESGSRVCLMESSRNIRCLYVDLASCQIDANRSDGACFIRPARAPRPAKP